MKDSYPIFSLCKAIKVNKNSYYKWIKRKSIISDNNKINEQITKLILKTHTNSKGNMESNGYVSILKII